MNEIVIGKKIFLWYKWYLMIWWAGKISVRENDRFYLDLTD